MKNTKSTKTRKSRRTQYNPELEYTPAEIARILDIDKSLCFICQAAKPTHLATVTKAATKRFTLCEDCSTAIAQETRIQNRVMQAIYLKDTKHIFEYTLGISPIPVKLTIEKLPQVENLKK